MNGKIHTSILMNLHVVNKIGENYIWYDHAIPDYSYPLVGLQHRP